VLRVDIPQDIAMLSQHATGISALADLVLPALAVADNRSHKSSRLLVIGLLSKLREHPVANSRSHKSSRLLLTGELSKLREPPICAMYDLLGIAFIPDSA